VLGGFSFVRGLVVREELSMGTDLASVALVTLVTVPLGALALGGYAHTHPPDKQLRDPGNTGAHVGNERSSPAMRPAPPPAPGRAAPAH
jgi:hypothetical protein